MQFAPPRRGNRTIINVTSLIDVMFLMLIFVMVTSTFKEQQPAIQLDLPGSTSARAVDEGPSVITLTEQGALFLDRSPIDESELVAALRARLAESGDDRIVLRADTNSQHGRVVHLIDLIKDSGYARVSLSARVETAEPGSAP
ncbi:MAG: biopolymer transporter ExbD [bacterium]|nr:biopolymer transporter ExbD [bacterium]